MLLRTTTDVLSFTTAYIVVDTPFLYDYTTGTPTSVTPAWYDCLWHVRVVRSIDWGADGSFPCMGIGCGTATRVISWGSTRLSRSIYIPSHPTVVHSSFCFTPSLLSVVPAE